MNHHIRITSLVFLAALGSGHLGVAAAAKWSVQPILDPTDATGNYASYTATGLNNSGVVVGQKGIGATTGFITGPNGVGMQSFGSVYGTLGIDDLGEAAGTAAGTAGAFISAPGSLTLTPIALLPGAMQSTVDGMSADGRIVGRNGHLLYPAGTYPNQWVWNQIYTTGPHGVGTTEWAQPATFGYVQAMGINSAGQIIANGWLASVNPKTGAQNTHALLTGTSGSGTQDLGTLGGDSSSAAGVNDLGQVAGSSQLVAGQTAEHAFLTGPNGAAMKDLGDLGGGQSSAKGRNKLGQVVGSSYLTANASDPVAFVTGPNGVGMRNLAQEAPLSGNAVLRVAIAINDKGQVIAQDTNSQSYLLTPLPDAPAATCTVTYKVTWTGFGLFQARVDVSNQSASNQSGWSVNWQYSARPLLVASNATVKLNGTAAAATPKASNKAIAAQSTVTFTLTGTTTGGKAPAVSGLTGTLGGTACATTVQ